MTWLAVLLGAVVMLFAAGNAYYVTVDGKKVPVANTLAVLGGCGLALSGVISHDVPAQVVVEVPVEVEVPGPPAPFWIDDTVLQNIVAVQCTPPEQTMTPGRRGLWLSVTAARIREAIVVETVR